MAKLTLQKLLKCCPIAGIWLMIDWWFTFWNHLWTFRPKFHLARLDTIRHVEPVELVLSSRAVRQARQPKCMGSTRRTCRDVTWRDEPSGIWALLRLSVCDQYWNVAPPWFLSVFSPIFPILHGILHCWGRGSPIDNSTYMLLHAS